MYGIKIYGKDKVAEKNTEALITRIDYCFNDLLLAIGSYATELYWAHTGIIYSFPESLSKEEYDILDNKIKQYVLHSSDKTSVQYMHKGYIEEFGRYIFTEILDIAGFKDIEKLKTFDPSIENIRESEAYIYFRCPNAEFWAIYSKNLDVIKSIKDYFNHTEDIIL